MGTIDLSGLDLRSIGAQSIRFYGDVTVVRYGPSSDLTSHPDSPYPNGRFVSVYPSGQWLNVDGESGQGIDSLCRFLSSVQSKGEARQGELAI